MIKRLAICLVLFSSAAYADIAVTPGAGKTVATTTDNSREFQNVVVSTSYVQDVSGVSKPVGYGVGMASNPVHEVGTANVNIVGGSLSASSVNYSTYTYGNLIGPIGTAIGGLGPNGQFSTFAVDSSSAVNMHITAGSIANTGFNVNNNVTLNALPTGTNNIGTVSGSTTTLQGSNGAGVTATAGALDMNIKSGSIANTGFNVNNNVTLNALPTGTNNIGTVSGSTTSLQSGGVAITATSGALDMNIKSGSIANTGFNVTGNLPTGTNNIGTVSGSTASLQSGGVAITATSGALDMNIKSGSIANTGFNVNNTPAVTQSGAWAIGNLNGVVISSFAATSTPQVNLTQIGSTTVTTAGGAAGELKLSVQVAGDSNTFTGGLAADGAAAATNRLGTLPGIAQTTFANGTAQTAGRNEALSVGTDGLLWVAAHPPMRPASFYSSISSASYTSTTDLACLPGNATNTVIVRRIVVSCTETTAGQVTLSVIRRSSADSGGTSASMLVGKDDSTSGSAVSVPLVYSAAPTKGTLDSFADIQTIGCMASATASPNDVLIENWNDKAKVLRGTAQEFCVSLATPQDLAGVTVTGGNFNVHFEWDEITTFTP